MMRMSHARKVIPFLLVSFIVVGVFGFLYFDMGMNANGQIAGCPFMGMTATCNMTTFEHISAWQNTFTALPYQRGVAGIAYLLLLAALAFMWMRHRPPIQRAALPAVALRLKEHAHAFNPLQELFSNGILHPKVF